MGRKGKWLSSLKKAFSPDSKKKVQKSVQENRQQQTEFNSNGNLDTSREAPPVPSELKDVKLFEAGNYQNKQSYSQATEPPVTEIPTVEEVVSVIKVDKYAGKPKQEVAAIKIQTAFRGYLARRALRALRGLVRLKLLMEGPTVKRQATHTLRCMQTLARVQSQIHTRRVRMLEENQALQRQLLQKHAKELEAIRIGEEWDHSLQSKEQLEANLLNKYEAAMRRERALAYAFTHQQTLKNCTRSANTMFMTSGNPSWGWSWLERWMSAHPWESHNTTGKEPGNNDQSSAHSASRSLVGGEISKSYARYQLNSDKLSPADSEKPVQKTSSLSSSTPSKSAARKLKTASPRSSFGGADDDSRSMVSVQSSIRDRRHSIATVPSVRDDESLGSSHGVPSYMVPTQSAKAKSRLGADKNGTPEKEKGPSGPAKKRLSYPPSPAKPRRHSGPPKLETNSGAVSTNDNNSTANGDEV